MPDNDNAILELIVQGLDRGDAPDSDWPNQKGEYMALCPFHADTHTGNFSVSERGYHCFACGESGSLKKLARHLGVDLSDFESTGLTLDEYAGAKKLPVEFLQKNGVKQVFDKQKKPYVLFMYRDERGKVLDPRFRFRMNERPKSRRGASVSLYGLWKLRKIRDAGWVLLVEGESDAQTAWVAGLPALGIPGASAWKAEWASLLDGVQVYAWHEPDQGGDALMARLRESFPDGKALTAPAGAKDISQAHLQGIDVKALIEELKASAIPLAEAMPETVKQAQSLAELSPWVRERLNINSKRETKLLVAEAIADWMLRNGCLVVDTGQDAYKGGRPYLVTAEHALWPLEKDSMPTRLALHAAGLNGTETTFAFVLEHLVMVALKSGERARLARWQERREHALYISCDPCLVARVNGQGLELVPNGTDGVWFAGDSTLPSWAPAASVYPMDLPAFSPALETQHEVPAYTPEVQRDLLCVWLATLLSGLRPLPALVCLGQRGGGKSTLARAIMRTLLGTEAELATLSNDKRDLEMLLTSSPLIGLDNVDGLPPDWLPDLIAASATGIAVEKRQLYTDNTRLSRPVTASMVITTRTGGFARTDVAERSLPILTGQFDDRQRLADSDLLADIEQQRNGLLSWAARTAWRLLEMRREAPQGLPLRFQDFARSVWAYLAMQGRQSETDGMLLALRAAQSLTIGEADELAAAIITNADELQNWMGTATDLVRTLTEMGAELSYLGGKRAITRRLREIQSTLALAGVTMLEEVYKGRPRFVIRTQKQLFRTTENVIDEVCSDEVDHNSLF